MRWANTVRDSPRSPHSIYNPPVASPRTSQPNTTRHDAVARIQEQLLRLGPRSPILQSAAVLESPARTPEQVLRSAQKIPVVQSAAVVESPARTQEQLLRSAQINPRDFGTVREKLSCQNHPDNLANISAGGEMATTHGSNLLDATSATVIIHKAEVIQIAKDQEKVIHEKLRRNGDEIPKYEFLEIIGKGAYGRVFKCHDQVHNRVVALKVIDVDATDYNINAEAKDDSIAATVHEIKVLQQLRDSRAKNVNLIFDAFQMHSQLWIVNDYCPGGSVHTLMRATGNKLEEKYILPIARELAIGLKAIHEAGIIHRDIKASNVMIHENGMLQVIDFGVAGVLPSKLDKRTSIIGTPFWMAPEMFIKAPAAGLKYGTEVDIWAYGCTLYEMAKGLPPNTDYLPGPALGARIKRSPPRLEDTSFSRELCSLIELACQFDAASRPSMDVILGQRYIVESETTHPTSCLASLVREFYRWEYSGGKRLSLFYGGGAAAAEYPRTLEPEEDWNFSTTANFDRQFVEPGNDYLLQSTTYHPATQQTNKEERVKRGEEAMKGLFDADKEPYKYEVKADFVEKTPYELALSRARSDLPLRQANDQYPVSHNELEKPKGGYGKIPNIDLANVDTIKANRSKRATKDWVFPGRDNQAPEFKATVTDSDIISTDSVKAADNPHRNTLDWRFPSMVADDDEPQPVVTRPALRHIATAPVGDSIIHTHRSILDLDKLYEGEGLHSTTSFDNSPDLPTSDDNPSHHHIMQSHDDSTVLEGDSTLHLPDVDIEHLFLADTETSDTEAREVINGLLTQQGETDELDRAGLRRMYLEARKETPRLLNEEDLYEGFAEMKDNGDSLEEGYVSEGSSQPFLWDYPDRFPSAPESDDEDTNPAIVDRSTGSSRATSASRSPFHGFGGYATLTAHQARRRQEALARFPNVIPPSAAALMHGAPREVLVNEFQRMLGAFLESLDVNKTLIDIQNEGDEEGHHERDHEGHEGDHEGDDDDLYNA